MIHDFGDKLAQGAEAERFLDALFAPHFRIVVAEMDWQRRGVDRFFSPYANPTRAPYRVEYKADWRAWQTHCGFVETVSVDQHRKPGWAYTSEAEILVYLVLELDLVYLFRMSVLRRHLPRWVKKYPIRPAKNAGYHTLGVCVPLWEFEKYSFEVMNLGSLPDCPPLPGEDEKP